MEVTFGGEEGYVRLGVASNGRVDRVAIRVGPLRGLIDVTLGLDLPRLRDALVTMLEGETLSGSVTLESVEHDFRLRVSLDHGKGLIEGEVTEQVATMGSLVFRLTTDQTFVRATLGQVDTLVGDVANPPG